MNKRDMQRLLDLVSRLSRTQRKERIGSLTAQTAASESTELVEAAGSEHKRCPHCAGERIVRNGTANDLQRYKCRACGKTFSALTGTPFARLCHKDKWLDQTGALADGLTVHRAAERLGEHSRSLATPFPLVATGRQARSLGRCFRD